MAGLARARLQVCAFWRESWFRSSLSYPNVSFTQRTVLCTDVTLHDDLVACAHKSRTRMSRSHAQPWQRGISHLLGVKTTGVTQCKQTNMSHMQLPGKHYWAFNRDVGCASRDTCTKNVFLLLANM